MRGNEITSSSLKNSFLNDQTSKEHVKFFAETHSAFKELTNELLQTLDKPEITLGISGGAFYSIISYEIVDYLLKKGMTINDIIGNSGGALVGALIATGNVKKEYVDNIFSHIKLTPEGIIKGMIPNIIVAIMAPFVLECSYKGEPIDMKDILMKHTDDLISAFSQQKLVQDGKLQESMLQEVIATIILMEKGPITGTKEEILSGLQVKKITFNDIKEKNKIDFRIMSTVVRPKNIFMFGKRAHLLKDFTFTGDFPVLDALLVSGSTPHTLNVKGVKATFLDGYASGNDMPTSPRNHAGHDPHKPLVLIDTHDDAFFHKFIIKKTYGDNQYIMSPNIHDKVSGVIPNFNDKNIPLFRQIAHDYLYGEKKSVEQQIPAEVAVENVF